MLMFSQGKLPLRWPKSLENLKGNHYCQCHHFTKTYLMKFIWRLRRVWKSLSNCALASQHNIMWKLRGPFKSCFYSFICCLFATHTCPCGSSRATKQSIKLLQVCRILKRGVGQENGLGQSGLLLSTAVTTLHYLRNFNLFDSTAWQDFIRISAIIICKTQFHWTL